MKKLIGAAVLAAFALTVSGCYESPGVTVHKAGVYKGKKDPLLKSDTQGRAETLQKRFTMVQIDR